jgi:myosin-1
MFPHTLTHLPLSLSLPPLFSSSSTRSRFRYSLTNNVYKSLQDNNEDQCIVMLGESSSGKTENCRMVIRFLSKISGRFIHPLQRQRSSNSIASYKSSPKSSCSTPKHKSSTSTIQSVLSQEKSSGCFKADTGGSGGKSKKVSRVEFDFSYQKCNDVDAKHDVNFKYCPKHNCCNVSSSSSTASNPIDIPVRRKSTGHHHHPNLPEFPGISKSFTIYETMNRVHNDSNKKVPNCLDHHQQQQQCEPTSSRQARCESLDLIKISNQNYMHKGEQTSAGISKSFDDSSLSRNHSEKRNFATQIRDPSFDRNKINLDNFKSAKRKVPIRNPRNFQLNSLEIQTMKERIAQAEIFLEAMGNASTSKNRDSSRYVSALHLSFKFNNMYTRIDLIPLYVSLSLTRSHPPDFAGKIF